MHLFAGTFLFNKLTLLVSSASSPEFVLNQVGKRLGTQALTAGSCGPGVRTPSSAN